jgi:choline transporter-like protein 2/4/5
VTFAIIIILAGGILASYTLIKAGKDARDSGTATNRSNAELGVGITLGIVTAIFLCVIIALRERIRIAIEVVKEANRCVHDIWALIVFPLLPMLLGLGYIVFWVVVTVYIFAVWSTKSETLPLYITDSSRFTGNAATGAAYAPLLNATTGDYNYFSYTWDSSMQRSFAYVFFHLLWTAQFIIYFTYMVMAGTVANWYFAPMAADGKRIVGNNPGELSHTPISDSCFRTCRFHVGTVALAAFIIAVVQFIRACVKYIEHKSHAAAGGQPNVLQRALFCLIHCCLYCLQSVSYPHGHIHTKTQLQCMPATRILLETIF